MEITALGLWPCPTENFARQSSQPAFNIPVMYGDVWLLVTENWRPMAESGGQNKGTRVCMQLGYRRRCVPNLPTMRTSSVAHMLMRSASRSGCSIGFLSASIPRRFSRYEVKSFAADVKARIWPVVATASIHAKHALSLKKTASLQTNSRPCPKALLRAIWCDHERQQY